MLRNALPLLAGCIILSVGSGCGVIFQTIAGYDREDSKVETVEQTIEIASLPEGAEVVQVVDRDRVQGIGTTPLKVPVAFEREVIVQSPASMRPFWLGVLVDSVLVVGSGVAVGVGASHFKDENNRAGAWAAWGFYVPTTLISEVVVGLIIANRKPNVVGRHDLHTSYEFAVRKEGYPAILARVDVPSVSKLTVPLDASAALRMNQPGSGTMLMFAKTSSVGSPLQDR